ncbi:hypothetical protein SBF1_6560002 [Candidatus Desulfosporosinus infrequens]|uniref:Uncharacterized protein n=1 Tax=Candidatus Desulfosporosinus infrequens TaxID=2043169 RepID=A0A2U3LN08_9FIRM|nr:hypothetical protein SBF1_6560002 [Candidatus Desulfosporosinus infrequens]
MTIIPLAVAAKLHGLSMLIDNMLSSMFYKVQGPAGFFDVFLGIFQF